MNKGGNMDPWQMAIVAIVVGGILIFGFAKVPTKGADDVVPPRPDTTALAITALQAENSKRQGEMQNLDMRQVNVDASLTRMLERMAGIEADVKSFEDKVGQFRQQVDLLRAAQSAKTFPSKLHLYHHYMRPVAKASTDAPPPVPNSVTEQLKRPPPLNTDDIVNKFKRSLKKKAEK